MSEETKTPPPVARGLEGIVAAATKIAEVDGEKGRLTLRGYDISELSGNVQFEEVAYLLWHGKLPNRKELDGLKDEMASARHLPGGVLSALRTVAPFAEGMDILRIGASMLSIADPTVNSLDLADCRRRAARLQAQMPAIVAHTYRLKHGLDIVEPKPEHGLAAGFLYMLEGKEPDPARVDGLNAYLVAIAEHGLNASTFTGRCIISTDSDMISALTGAIGALKGSKHGGVPGPVLKMLQAIGNPEFAESFIRHEIRSGRRIMGFGHRVYKVRDPRAARLQEAAEKMAALTNDYHLLELTKSVEETTVRVLAEEKPGRDLYANVELYAALILHAVGVPSEIFTPIFGIGRTSGWTAHMLEQIEDNRLIRPASVYVGPHGLKYVPVDERE
ncbi:MAG: citrate/2-methylcitrate synthase [Capsulimonadales bacterium]|nr:citrate/2-methylcitrate synthase [Capsulimonadales bacterium]